MKYLSKLGFFFISIVGLILSLLGLLALVGVVNMFSPILLILSLLAFPIVLVYAIITKKYHALKELFSMPEDHF